MSSQPHKFSRSRGGAPQGQQRSQQQSQQQQQQQQSQQQQSRWTDEQNGTSFPATFENAAGSYPPGGAPGEPRRVFLSAEEQSRLQQKYSQKMLEQTGGVDWLLTEEMKETPTSSDYYFDSYSHYAIHEEMLQDSVRTGGYRNAILGCAHLFQDKVVLDVGCGTGILCMFAAQAGARHVIGVDCSEMINHARKIVQANNLENKITLIKGKVEEVELPEAKVDIIISEWMGYFLLYESMLDSVLFARDKWLSPGGLIFPDKAEMFICGIEDRQFKRQKFQFWNDVYGFDMRAIKPLIMREPLVDTIEPQSVVTSVCSVKKIDIMTVTKEELMFHAPFDISFQTDTWCHALVSYFDVYFTFGNTPLSFSTSPFTAYTHWKQTVLYLERDLQARRNDRITGLVSVRPNRKNHRDIDIRLAIDLVNHRDKVVFQGVQFYSL